MILLLLTFCPCPAAIADSDIPNAADDIKNFNYIQLEFRDFPLSVLLKIKKVAPALENIVPADLQVGMERQQGEGVLIFSYEKDKDRVQLKMSLMEATTQKVPVETLLDFTQSIASPSTESITGILKDLFVSFCNTWKHKHSTKLARIDDALASSLQKAENEFLL